MPVRELGRQLYLSKLQSFYRTENPVIEPEIVQCFTSKILPLLIQYDSILSFSGAFACFERHISKNICGTSEGSGSVPSFLKSSHSNIQWSLITKKKSYLETTAYAAFGLLAKMFMVNKNYKEELIRFSLNVGSDFHGFFKVDGKEPSEPNFQKYLCLVNYFIVMGSRILYAKAMLRESADDGNCDRILVMLNRKIILERAATEKSFDHVEFLASCGNAMVPPIFEGPSSRIEDSSRGMLFDFANKFVGGGVLTAGCVQEEILFCMFPECILLMLLCPRLDDPDTLRISGVTRFNEYSSYGLLFKWEGPYNKSDPKISEEETYCIGVADATNFSSIPKRYSRERVYIERDIMKLTSLMGPYFHAMPKERVLRTGHWGCGVFGGEKEIKFIAQWIVASALDWSLVYCGREEFNTNPLSSELSELVELVMLNELSVAQVYSAFVDILIDNSYHHHQSNNNNEVYKYYN